jgi:hypothetical protein
MRAAVKRWRVAGVQKGVAGARWQSGGGEGEVRLRVRVCVCVSLSVSCLCLSLWLARNGRANVWRMEIYGALLVQRERCTRRRATGGRSRTGIRELVAPVTLCPMLLAPC